MNNKVTHYIHNDYFVIDQVDMLGIYEDSTEMDHMVIYTCMEGSFNVNWQDMILSIGPGETVLMPACVGEYKLLGEAKILKSYLPTEQTKASSLVIDSMLSMV